MTSFSIGTSRTIGTNGPLKLPCTQPDPRGGTLGISGWGCADGTLEPLTYTRASSAEFYTRVNSQIPLS